MPKFRVVAGKHHVRTKDGEVAYGQGCASDIVDISVEEANKFANKFVPVVQDEPAPAPVPTKPEAPAPAAKK
jgi:hypothetical protein